MKVRRLTALVLAAVFCLCGCVQPTDPTTQPSTEPVTQPVTEPVTEPTAPTAEITLPSNPGAVAVSDFFQLRLPGYEESYLAKFHSRYGDHARVSSTADLNAVLESLARDGAVAEAPEKYDAVFFQTHDLILIPVSSNTGSARYKVEINEEGSTLTLTVQAIPFGPDEAYTCDMADWLMLVPLDRNLYGEHRTLIGDSGNPPEINDATVSDK